MSKHRFLINTEPVQEEELVALDDSNSWEFRGMRIPFKGTNGVLIVEFTDATEIPVRITDTEDFKAALKETDEEINDLVEDIKDLKPLSQVLAMMKGAKVKVSKHPKRKI